MTEKQKENINAEVGVILDITLSSQMSSTGYGWELSPFKGPISLVGITVVPSTYPGGYDQQIFHFKIWKTGEAIVEFILARAWEIAEPINEHIYGITCVEPAEKKDDDLKLKSFVPKPTVATHDQVIPPYNVQPPTQDYGILCRYYYGVLCNPGDPRLYYGVRCSNDDPRLYYGVCCDPSASTNAGDIRFYYGVLCNQADPRLYYGTLCAPSDPKVYYGVNCAPDTDLCNLKYGVKYGIWPRPTYNIVPLYNVPIMRYNYPDCK